MPVLAAVVNRQAQTSTELFGLCRRLGSKTKRADAASCTVDGRLGRLEPLRFALCSLLAIADSCSAAGARPLHHLESPAKRGLHSSVKIYLMYSL